MTMKINKFALAVGLVLATGSAFAQNVGTPGAGLSGGYPNSATTTGPISSPGVGTTPSNTVGIGNGNNTRLWQHERSIGQGKPGA
jgi:hypothetical protein